MSDEELEAIGAGDQGMMFGYRNQRDGGIYAAARSLWRTSWHRQLTKVRKDGTLTYLRPDGKSSGNCRIR